MELMTFHVSISSIDVIGFLAYLCSGEAIAHQSLGGAGDSNLANMGVGNSTTPSIMFMLEPAVATVSICLPAISALVTRGLKHVPTSYIRNTWPKRPSSSSTNRASVKSFSPTFKSLPYLVSRRDRADPKKQQLLPIARRSSVNENYGVNSSASGDLKNAEAVVVAGDRPSSTFSRASVVDERLLSKSLEVERRVRQYYQRSDFPHGTHETLHQEIDRDSSKTNPLPVPLKDSLDPAPS